MSYGQTGAGKTYTMLGGEGVDRGLLPRTTQMMFERARDLERYNYSVSFSICFGEIYNDKMTDLLTGKEIKLINESCLSRLNIMIAPVNSLKMLEQKIEVARNKRSTAKTQANECSSRSHAIYNIQLEITNKSKKKLTPKRGTITIVDLAGSEKLDHSKTEGKTEAERIGINKSLTGLRSVISALNLKQKHIPYKDSKLTQVLENYLGKDSKTLVIINVAPCDSYWSQTKSSLEFGKDLKACKNQAVIRQQNLGGSVIINSASKSNGSLVRSNSAVKLVNPIIDQSVKKTLQTSRKMDEERNTNLHTLTPVFTRLSDIPESERGSTKNLTHTERKIPTMEANKENIPSNQLSGYFTIAESGS